MEKKKINCEQVFRLVLMEWGKWFQKVGKVNGTF